MADDKIVIQIQLDDGTVKDGFLNIKKEAESAAKGVDNSFGGLTKGVVAGNLIAEGIKKAISAVKELGAEAINSAKTAEQSLVRIANAFALNGKYSKEAVSSFVEYTDQLERQTGVSADLIKNQAATLSSLTGLTGQGLEKATKAALDLSAATGKDLSTAFQLLSRAGNGSDEILKKYGIRISSSIPESERFAAAVDQINKKFGDLSKINLNTFGGIQNALSLSFGKLLESFGNLIVLSPTIKTILKFIIDGFYSLAKSLSSVFGKDFLGPFIDKVLSAGLAISKGLLPPLEILFNILKTGAGAIATFVLATANAFVKLGALFEQYIVSPILTFFGDKLVSIIGVFSEDAASKLRSVGDGIINYYKTAQQSAVQGLSDLTIAAAEATADAANNVLETKASDFATKTIENLKAKIEEARAAGEQKPDNNTTGPDLTEALSVTDALGLALKGADEQIKQLAKTANDGFKSVGKSAVDGIGKAVGGAFAEFGKALKNGDNALKAFASAFIASVGQTAIALGQEFILRGAAYAFSGDSRLEARSGPLIAAGAALATFGGVLSAVGGGASGGGGGGAASPSEGEGGALLGSDLNQLEQEKQQNAISVNIQGDVLDSKDTSLRIVELIQQYGDLNGGNTVVS